jgi:hypothetical protein
MGLKSTIYFTIKSKQLNTIPLYPAPPQAQNALIVYKFHVMECDDKVIISQLKPRVLLFSPLVFSNNKDMLPNEHHSILEVWFQTKNKTNSRW